MFRKLKRKVFLSFTLIFSFIFPSQATVLRKDVISYSLDYYEIQQQELTALKMRQEQEQKNLNEKKQAVLSRWKDRKEKINKFLDNLLVSLEFKSTYNDNVFLKETQQESDIVTIASVNVNYIPKVDWERKGKTDFFFDFQGDGLSFSTGKSKEATRTGLRTGLNYRMSDKYAALLDYQFIKSTATASGGSEGGGDFVQNITNTFGTKLSADWGRFPCSLRYTHETSNYEEDFKTADTTKDVMTLTGNVKISSKTQVFFQYDYGEVAYPHNKNSDYVFNTYSVGIRGKLSPKIAGVVKLGWGEYDYDIDTKRETENINADINYRLSNRFLFSAGGGRSIEASTYSTDDRSEQRTIHLQCRYFPPFNKKLTLRGGLSFTNIMFDETDRQDDTAQLRLGVDYGLNKRTKLALNYTHNSRESNIEGKDYKQNIVTMKSTFDF